MRQTTHRYHRGDDCQCQRQRSEFTLANHSGGGLESRRYIAGSWRDSWKIPAFVIFVFNNLKA